MNNYKVVQYALGKMSVYNEVYTRERRKYSRPKYIKEQNSK